MQIWDLVVLFRGEKRKKWEKRNSCYWLGFSEKRILETNCRVSEIKVSSTNNFYSKDTDGCAKRTSFTEKYLHLNGNSGIRCLNELKQKTKTGALWKHVALKTPCWVSCAFHVKRKCIFKGGLII